MKGDIMNEDKQQRETVKRLLRNYGWIIDICEDVERKDSEILLQVVREFNEIYPTT